MTKQHDTICAVATAPGRGGVGIVRVSGPLSDTIARRCCEKSLSPRLATFTDFKDEAGNTIDQGIALLFKGPNSFTGEDVFEFQGHGGPVIMDMVLSQCQRHGARLARPGEFSERAFLNDKMDLTQAEAIADLIDASSKQAAIQAVHSLKGAFAAEIDVLLEALTHLRLYVESAIDFPEEEIDFLNDGVVESKLSNLITQCHRVFDQARQGAVLRDGLHVVLAGKPNAGKSTLLNTLAQREVAIVTDIPGTTRDTLTEHIHLDGMPLHITDTAGIRETDNEVERIGIARARKAIDEADRILLLLDAASLSAEQLETDWPEFINRADYRDKLTLVINKVDQNPQPPSIPGYPVVPISALHGTGLDTLKAHLLESMGVASTTESTFSARRRHLDALQRCLGHLDDGQAQLHGHAAGELLAEDLRLAQDALGEITGRVSPDELLGKIFSSFCIGK